MSGDRRTEADDVDELLKATEDGILLDLSVGSHISKVAPSYIDSDLNRRFQALKKPSSAAVSASSSKPITSTIPSASESVDDLLARFAALKGTPHDEFEQKGNDCLGGDLNEEDEVEKLVQWAKDAARLDPSPPTDSDDSDNFQPSDVDEDSDVDSENDEVEEKKKPAHKKKLGIKRGLRIFR